MTAGGYFGSWLGGGGGGTSVAPGPLGAGDLIDAARKQHPAFREQAIPTPVALELLSGVYHELQQEGLALDPNVSATELVHYPNTPAWDPSIVVPIHTALVSGTVAFVSGSPETLRPLVFVAYGDRFTTAERYAAYEEGDLLMLVGAEADWQGVDFLTVRYLAAPAVLTAAADTLYLPISARPAVVSALAYQFILRCEALGLTNLNPQGFLGKAQRAHDAWLATMGRAGRPRLLHIEDVT